MKSKKKENKYLIRSCPKCKSDDVGVSIGGQMGIWECHACGFRGPSFLEQEMSEEEFLEYEEKKGNFDFDFGDPEIVEEKKPHKEMLKEKISKGERL